MARENPQGETISQRLAKNISGQNKKEKKEILNILDSLDKKEKISH
jgi:hypothetical protein